ncbi:MAG: ribosomal protein S18-alanine N-acetyltransferase [Oscillospiraceae bacterium]|nr:ribosomal protein S18-alanine N-acetyltransferase [Oscillospiraceae bacterium]
MFAKRYPAHTAHSAGLSAAQGNPASGAMQILAPIFGVDLSAHASRQLTPALVEESDRVVCLAAAHARQLAPFVPWKKLRVLGGGIADPFGGSLTEYRACTGQIVQAMPALYAGLKNPAHICQTEDAHLPAIAALEREVFHPPCSESTLRKRFCNESPNHKTCFLSALLGGELVGFISVDEVAGEAFIDDLAVWPGHWRRGIGGALLAQAETNALLRGSQKVHLEVRESNASARALYLARGYAETGRRKGFYEQPKEDAILMTLEIH